MGVFYTTRESVKLALDAKETARADWQIDDAIEAASRAIEHCTNRVFYPWAGIRYLDWPDPQNGTSYVLWLDENEAISVSAVMSGDETIAPSAYNLEPINQAPPYNRIELKLSGPGSFGQSNTHQRDVAVTGVFGYRNDESAVGTITAALSDTTGTTVSCSDPQKIGVGSLLRIDTERMIVTDKATATSGQTVQVDVTAQPNVQTIAVVDGTAFRAMEVILIDAERMRVDDVAGNNLIVTRAWDGSTLGPHSGSTIYRRTALTVERGVLGTTAATHLNAAAVSRWDPPGQIRQLARAQALDTVLQEQSGYARTIKPTDTAHVTSVTALSLLWSRVEQDFRRLRLGAV